jgi:FAD/FMN-containing dehydrogenase
MTQQPTDGKKRKDAWSELSAILEGMVASTDKVRMAVFGTDETGPPERVIQIRDPEMLAQTIKTARGHGVPLFAASSQPPHKRALHGITPESWVLDFSFLKRILKVNRRNRVAMFEAGVTFEELTPHIGREGMRLMMPLMPRGGKSVMAACMDREPTIYPRHQWDLSDPLLCLEVVYGTGDLFRTGAAAGPGSLEEQWAVGDYQKSPMGPGQNDWFRMIQGAQGTIALATWASAKCEVKPEMEKLFIVGTDNLQSLIDASYRLFYRKIPDIYFILDRNALAVVAGETESGQKEIRARAADWNMVYSVSGIEYFPEERIRYLAREAEKEIKAQGIVARDLSMIDRGRLLKRLSSIDAAGVDTCWKDRQAGAHRSIYFQTTMDRATKMINSLGALAKNAEIPSQRQGYYLQPQLGGRCCHVELVVAADVGNKEEIAEAEAFCREAASPMIAEGAFFSRPHGSWATPAMESTPSAYRIFEKVKHIFDPDNILAPGRLTLGGDRHA